MTKNKMREKDQKHYAAHRDEEKERTKQYRSINKDKVKKWNRKWSESSFRTFLLNKISNSRCEDRRTGRKNNIDIEYILDLLRLQDNCCAATGVKMVHISRNLRCVSIDRLDSTQGHIKGNVQLVCLFYNLGKKTYSDIEARSIIQEIEMNLLKKLKEHSYLNL